MGRPLVFAEVARSAVEAFMRDQELMQSEGQSLETVEMLREEAIIELADTLGISEEETAKLWSAAEAELGG